MDEIFQECRGLRGAFDVVRIAREKPRRYDKHGNLLINYDDTEYAHRRHPDAADPVARTGSADEKGSDDHMNVSEERKENA